MRVILGMAPGCSMIQSPWSGWKIESGRVRSLQGRHEKGEGLPERNGVLVWSAAPSYVLLLYFFQALVLISTLLRHVLLRVSGSAGGYT
ncbi:hypothetical protein [Pontibacter amylolyticus]|uniref:Uncharacterized protein n=1 Tax=Pontibacter amylolyticus TaxID=1424080 RepID=A0ABQ1WBH2_9BACT|nr:hypothetical protein [Pontibacter amylolyticus]GGG23207.1 hypothetical protein GCM10011323_28940 [Pontibacter amylolyticus]